MAVQDAPDSGPPGPPDLKDWEGRLPRTLAKDPTATPLASPLPSPPPPPEFQTWGTVSLESGWNMVSLPVAEVTSLQLGSGVLEFGFAWDPVARAYQVVDLRDMASLAAGEATGRGFWVYTSQAAQIQYVGWPNSGSYAHSDVNLAAGWNLLGFPYDQVQAFSGIRVKATGALQPLTSSVSATLPPPSPNILLFGVGFTYGSQAYQSLDLSVPAGTFQVGKATWVYVYEANTLLRYGPGAATALTACKSNLASLGTALKLYSNDYAGRYPISLTQLTPNYLATIPTCPAAGTATYLAGFTSVSNPDAYTVCCKGLNHASAGLPQDFPQYNSVQGLVEH